MGEIETVYTKEKPEVAQKLWYQLMTFEYDLTKIINKAINNGMEHADAIRALEGCKLGVISRFINKE